jgi:hypothetical protein
MYQLDHRVEVQEITNELMDKLLADGYLQSMPLDPGYSEGASWKHYRIDSNGDIFCIQHGFVSLDSANFSQDLPPYEQLLLTGETKSDLLQAASRKSPTARTFADDIALEIYTSTTAYGMVIFVVLFLILLPLGARRIWPYIAITPLRICVLSFPIAGTVLVGGSMNGLWQGIALSASFYLLTLSVWSFRFLRKANTLDQLIAPVKNTILEFDDEIAAKFSTAFTKSADRYVAVIVAMGMSLGIIGVSGGYMIMRLNPHGYDLTACVLVTLISLGLGAFSGVLRFISSLNSGVENPGHDGTRPWVRIVLTILIPGYYMYLYLQGLYYLDSGYGMMGAFIPFTIACFLIGRASAAYTLNRKFVHAYDSLREQHQNPDSMKKDVTEEELDSLQGISATPSRGTW